MRIYRYVGNCLSKKPCERSQGRSKVRFALMILLLTIMGMVACKKENEPSPPMIAFFEDSTLVSSDTMLKAGSAFRVGLRAVQGDTYITNIYVARIFEGGMEVIIDSGIHDWQFDYYKTFNKGVYPSEKWIFRVKDISGLWAETGFTLTNLPGSNYDSVLYFPAIQLGAQQNTGIGSFLDINHNHVYFQDDAYHVQDSIEFLYYYDPAGDANTISSPNANIDATIYTGATSLTNWTIKHEVRFYKTTLSTSDFDAVLTDSLLIASYDALNAKRKAKNLTSGDVYSFKTAHGKFGLFKVLTVTGAETGSVDFAVKIQKD